jgi:GH35 family endo-1,4-beta-xylanase
VSIVALAGVLCFSWTGSLRADWKSDANARIEQIRKRDVRIIVTDRYGAPVPGAVVRADQTRHTFAFGTAINMNAVTNEPYADFFNGHFEWATFENEAKWFNNEPIRDLVHFDSADALVEFCVENGIKIRGHNIFWAKEQYTPPWSRSLPEPDLREEVEERLDQAVAHFAQSFLHWDVNNEMLDGDFFRRKLGADIEPYMFVRTKAIDPDVLTFTNDYSIIAGSAARTDAYIASIRSLEARGGPVHTIGVQGHFWGSTVDPVAILARLDQLAVLEKPVWVTEYDVVDSNEETRADKLENLYRAAFSHPIVHGIFMWGFWAGSHWRGEDAAIVDLDWTVNAAGRRYEALLEEWTTHASGTTGDDGAFSYRGFHGTYVVDVAAGKSDPPPITVEAAPGDYEAAFLVPLKTGSCFAAAEVGWLAIDRDVADGAARLSWHPVPIRADVGSRYDVLRSPAASDFLAAAECLVSGTAALETVDASTPGPGSAYYYLVRGSYDCPGGEGPLGVGSDRQPRVGRSCP